MIFERGPASARHGRRRQAALLLTTALATIVMAAPVAAQDIPAPSAQPASAGTRAFDIPAQPLATAVNAFGRQSGLQVTADTNVTTGVQTQAVVGAYPPAEALSRLLAGTGVTWRMEGDTIVVLTKAPQSSDGSMQLGPVRVEGSSGTNASLAWRDPGRTEDTGSYTSRAVGVSNRMNLSLRETPQSVSIITRQQIDDQNLVTLEDVLRQTPGIVMNATDERVTISSRGFGMRVMYDGVPSITSNSAEPNLLNIAIYDRVEVLRGAAGLLNGAGSPGGAVNLVRKRPTDTFSANFTAGIGSWNRYLLQADAGGKLNEAGTIRARAVATFSDGDSFIDARKSRETVLYAISEFDLTANTVLSIGAEYHDRTINGPRMAQVPPFYSDGTPTDLPRSFNPSVPWGYWQQKTRKIFATLDHRFDGGWQIKADLSYARNSRDWVNGYIWAYPFDVDPDSGESTLDFQMSKEHSTAKTFDIYASGPVKLFSNEDQIVIGGNLSSLPDHSDAYQASDLALGPDRRRFNIFRLDEVPRFEFDKLFYVRENKTTEGGLYGAVQLHPFERLSILAGGRLSWYKRTGLTRFWRGTSTGQPSPQATVQSDGVFTPYAGAVLDITADFSVYASYTDIFIPNTAIDINGDVLAPQRGYSIELGIKGEHFDGRLNTAISVFRSREDNLAVRDGTTVLPDGTPVYIGVKGAKSEGFEVTVAGELVPGLQVSGGYTYTRKRDRFGTLLNPNYPRHLGRLTASYRLPGKLDAFMLGANLSYQSSATYRESYGLGIIDQPAVVLIGLMANYDITDATSLALNVENLLDKTYYSGVGGYNGYSYGNPRNVTVRLRHKF